MARYIDADEVISQIESSTAETWGKGLGRGWWSHAVMLKDNIVRLIQRTPTADVAPRAEVARGIFWEMDKLLLSITIDEEAEESFVGFDFDKYIALKKKYTGGE